MPLLNQLVCFQWLMSGTPSLFYFQRLLDPCRHVSYVRRPQETHQSPENYQPLADWRVRFKLCFAQMNDSCRLSICLLCWAFQSFPNPALLPVVPWQEALLLTILWTHSTTFVFVSSTESPFYWILPILTPSCPKAIITFFFSLPGQSPSSACMHAKLLQSCLSLLQLKDHSPPGSSVSELHQVNQWNLCCHGLCSRRKEDCVWYFLILLQHLSWCWFHSRHSANSHCGFKCI